MIHLVRLLLIVSLCIALSPMRGGSMASAQGCPSQAVKVDVCVAPVASAVPSLPQTKPCISYTLTASAALVPPKRRELAAMTPPAPITPSDQTAATDRWRPPRG